MASISALSYITSAPSQSLVSQTAAATSASATANTTIYVTNANGSISVTTTNAQGEIVDLSTIPAPYVTSPSGAGVSASVGGRTPGALLSLVA
jgi:hypothetical protein